MKRAAAYIYSFCVGLVVILQLSLALGAPLGSLAMGGFVEGQFPPAMRVAAIVQGALLIGFAWVILSKAGVLTKRTPPSWAIWVVLVVAVLSLIANLATPSAAERMLGAPVVFVMLISALWVKFGPGGMPPD